MDSTLVVCYSYTGTGQRAARLLCSHHGWTLGEVRDASPRGTLRCVLDSLLRRHPDILYDGPHPGEFRNVVLLAPIWMYRLAGPMRTFVAQHRTDLPRTAVAVTMNSAGAADAFREIADILGHGLLRGAAFKARSIDDGTGTGELLDFGKGLDALPVHVPAGRAALWALPMD